MDYEKAGAQTAAWVLKTTSPHAVPEGPDVLRDSAVTAAAVELAANRIIDVAEPDVMFMVNGILVEEHVLAKVARGARGQAGDLRLRHPREHDRHVLRRAARRSTSRTSRCGRTRAAGR